MDATPTKPRRWFGFKLSTIFVLVAIAAWGMASRPFFTRLWSETPQRFNMGPFPDWLLRASDELDRNAIPGIVFWLDKDRDGVKFPYALNPRLRRPAAALLVFLAWKAGWAIVARRRARRAEATQT